METKLKLKLLLLFIVIATMTIINGGIAHAKSSSHLFSSARKEYVSSKSTVREISPQEISIAMGIAEERTQALEQQIKIYLNVHEMGFWDRWIKSVNIYEVRENYARHVLSHLKAMTDVLKLRRLNGNKFSSINEFQFNILLRQSEFVLNVSTTKDSFVRLPRKSLLTQRLDKAIYMYNQERLVFDAKMVAWNE